jgi:DNA-binding protein H-NS
MRDDFIKEPPVANWLASIPYQKTFEKNADQVRNLTPAQQRSKNLNIVDMGLAESLIKLYDPQGVIREFKWEKMTSHQPTLDVLNSGPSIYLKRNGTFTPETRKELIRMGEEIVQGREEAAQPFIAKTKSQIDSIPNAKLSNVLTSEDQRIAAEQLAKKSAPKAAPAAASAPPFPGAQLYNHPTFGRIWMNGLNWQPAP